jgi:hypothetical protein
MNFLSSYYEHATITELLTDVCAGEGHGYNRTEKSGQGEEQNTICQDNG